MSKNSIKTWGGQLYETPAVDVVELEVEQPIFQASNAEKMYEEQLGNLFN